MTGRQATVAVAALGVALLAALALGVRARDLYLREEGLIEQLNGLASAQRVLTENALAISAGADRDFDRIAASMRALRDIRALAKDVGSAELDAVAHEVAEEEHAVELLKTDIALYWSSSLAFPAAASLVPVQGAEASALDALRTDVVRFVAAPERDKGEHVRAEVAVIASSPSSLDAAGLERRAVVLGHARALVEHRERVDHAVQTLTRSGVAERLTRLAVDRDRLARRGVIAATASLSTCGFLLLLVAAVAVELVMSRRQGRR